MKIKHKSFKAEFKPGTYFIGDPCYALRDDLYEKWGNEDNFADDNYGYFAVGSTAYGDGTYEDVYSGNLYGVDAGILGIVNMDYANPNANENDILNRLGKVITVEKSLIFEYDCESFTFKYLYDDNHNIEIPTVELDYDEEDEIENEW